MAAESTGPEPIDGAPSAPPPVDEVVRPSGDGLVRPSADGLVRRSVEAREEAVTKTAGRGGLAIGVAKISFVAFGFAQQVALPAVLGTQGYGNIARVLAVSGIVNNVVTTLSIQGVSRTVSSVDDTEAPSVLRTLLRYHFVVALVLAGIFAGIASPLADALEAPALSDHLRIVSAVVFLYGLYAPIVGSLNGRRRFLAQAGLDIFYGGLRFVTMVAGAWAMVNVAHRDGVMGGVIGFTVAAGIILPIAASRAGLFGRAPASTSAASKTPTPGKYAVFLAPLALGLISLNLLLQTDFLLFSRFVGAKATALGETQATADAFVGSYRAFQLFSFLPYQLLMSVTFVLFPMLAKSHADGDREAVARYTKTGVRLALILVGLFAGVVAGLPYALLRFAFSDPQIAELGAKAQPWHAGAMGLFALLGVATTVLTSLGREVISALLNTLGVGLVAGASFVLTRQADFGGPMMVSSAIATLAAMAVTLAAAAIALKRVAGAIAPVATLVRVGLATAAAIGVGHVMPKLGRFLAPAEAIAVALVYVVVLVVTGELGRADLATVRAVAGRKR